MDHCARRNESANSFKVVSDGCISFLDVLTLKVENDLCESTVLVNRHRCFTLFNQAILDARLVIIFSETGGAVHNASTGV